MLIEEFFNKHYRPRKLLGKSQDTVRLYLLSVRSFGKTLGKRPILSDLSVETVTQHMQRVLDDGRSPATANKDRAQLVTLWRFAYQLKMHKEFPDVPQLNEPERTPEAWLREDLQKLFAAVDRQTGHFDAIPRSVWWRSILLVFLDTGERIGAVSAAEWGWINGEWINFPAECRKGHRRDRAYRLSPEALQSLVEVREKTRDYKRVYPFPYSSGYLWQLYGKLLKDAGLPHGRRDKFHRLRRTVASVVYAAGLDPQDAMDHQYRRTTRRYLDPRFQKDKAPCDVLAEYLKNPGKPGQNPPNELGAG